MFTEVCHGGLNITEVTAERRSLALVSDAVLGVRASVGLVQRKVKVFQHALCFCLGSFVKNALSLSCMQPCWPSTRACAYSRESSLAQARTHFLVFSDIRDFFGMCLDLF